MVNLRGRPSRLTHFFVEDSHDLRRVLQPVRKGNLRDHLRISRDGDRTDSS